MNIHWDAQRYGAGFSFVHKYGEDVLGLIRSGAGAHVLDLGCGNGALTEKLASRGFEVLGLDDSEEMLEAARRLHPELSFRRGNAIDFKLERAADVVFSNAVFHWIDAARQDEMARNIFRALRTGGELVTEFGGRGCAERVHSTLERIFARRGLHYPRVFFFPTVGEYASILERAGFRVEEAYLFDRPTPQKGEDGLKDWIRMFVKKAFEDVGAEEKEEILEEAAQELAGELCHEGAWYIDYVRIRVRAVKPGQ